MESFKSLVLNSRGTRCQLNSVYLLLLSNQASKTFYISFPIHLENTFSNVYMYHQVERGELNLYDLMEIVSDIF